jgi:hypothetical protein
LKVGLYLFFCCYCVTIGLTTETLWFDIVCVYVCVCVCVWCVGVCQCLLLVCVCVCVQASHGMYISVIHKSIQCIHTCSYLPDPPQYVGLLWKIFEHHKDPIGSVAEEAVLHQTTSSVRQMMPTLFRHQCPQPRCMVCLTEWKQAVGGAIDIRQTHVM